MYLRIGLFGGEACAALTIMVRAAQASPEQPDSQKYTLYFISYVTPKEKTPHWGQGQGVRVRSRVTFRVGAERVKGRRQAMGLHLGQVGQGRLVGVCDEKS